MSADPRDAISRVQTAVTDARHGVADTDRLLDALSASRQIRDQLAAWEPELIAAARANDASWATLASALGVASRQAAERRYLRLHLSPTGETTGEARVRAERDKRAGDRAVTAWARDNSATLRQLAGQVSALDNLDTAAQEHAGHIQDALGDDDAANLLSPLAAAHPHLTGDHSALAVQLTAVSAHTDQLRRDAVTRRGRTHDQEGAE